jgi:hypothetical protein
MNLTLFWLHLVAYSRRRPRPAAERSGQQNQFRRTVMSKGLDSKKGGKKKPVKTLKEKRAAKNEKKKNSQ